MKAEERQLAEAEKILDKAFRRPVNGSKEKWQRNLHRQAMKAAKMGLAKAQYWVGRNYHLGYGVQENPPKAAEWLRRAAEQGYSDAQVELGFMYHSGEGVALDKVEAFKFFSKAAEAEEPAALYMMAMHYLEDCDEMHEKLAFYYFMKAAMKGEKNSQYEVACMLWKGEVVPRDSIAAQYWCREAEAQGCSEAMVWHARRIITGDIDSSCEGEEIALLKRAAELGNDEAKELLCQYNEDWGKK